MWWSFVVWPRAYSNCNSYSILVSVSPVIENKPTFCRICEPLCGMVATVEDGRLVALRPDKDHPLSSGFACQKGIAFTEVVNDPDRVTTPLRRGPNGFEPVSWDEAMTDIAARLSDILRRHGSGAIGWYMGNPAAFSYSHLFGVMAFIKGVGRHSHYFTASSQDTSNRLAASQFLYGTPTSVPIPDVMRTDLLVMMGANPVVSHGSFLTVPRIKDRMHDIVKRGGRVVVVDPRKTETATQFEWLGIVPDSDAYFLLSLLQAMFADGLVDRERVGSQADGLDWLQRQCETFTPEDTVALTGIEPDVVRALARDLATTPPRESRSENSWMHNAPLLMRGERIHRALMHLDDAAQRQIGDGDTVAVRSPYGRIALPISLTADIVPGTIAVPHGWGHKGTGGWRLANRADGVNVNQLMSSDPKDVEALAGMSWLTSVPVEVERVRVDSGSRVQKVE
jgi:anaerobic selenocysteine-containing dehydrogenase